MAGSVVEKRIENEGFLAAFGGSRRRIGSVIWIEHAWLARLFGVGIGRGRDYRGRRCARRQVEPAFASAAPEREHGRAQNDDGPSLCRAVVAIHDMIPNATAPYKHCAALARPGQS